ncbi:MAG: WsbD [Candidatus Levybacteria bacterium GW2011_GWA2_40_16]|nr:MAG: WsbD [Candidatus Levybacteria bacterium GW2011_GWA1_39_11]KKR50109.1 MAG: WsbD [Candidatus Levybacteria bacterium GW2011_GWA2_40_16]
MVDVSIIIVSFNTKELTVECVRSVFRTVKKSSFEIIVVDNASEDNSVGELKRLKTKNLKLKIIENSGNFGFSKANNIGIKESQGRYVLFLNSDTLVYENTIDGMINFMDENSRAGASTCFVRLPDGKLDDASHRGFPTPWRAFSHFSGLARILRLKPFTGYNLSHLSLNKTHKIDALAGAFMLVRRVAGDDVGWWDEDYFWYGEDLDFCYRLKKNGWEIYFVPEFEILHYKGASGGLKKQSKHLTVATSEIKKIAHEARFNAMKIFYSKHYKKRYPSIVHDLVLSGIKLKKLVSRIKL